MVLNSTKYVLMAHPSDCMGMPHVKYIGIYLVTPCVRLRTHSHCRQCAKTPHHGWGEKWMHVQELGYY